VICTGLSKLAAGKQLDGVALKFCVSLWKFVGIRSGLQGECYVPILCHSAKKRSRGESVAF